MSPDSDRSPLARGLLVLARVWLPLGIAAVGVAFAAIGHGKTDLAAVGVCLILVALSVWLINWLFRMSIESNREREDEEEARRVFERTGQWPDEA